MRRIMRPVLAIVMSVAALTGVDQSLSPAIAQPRHPDQSSESAASVGRFRTVIEEISPGSGKAGPLRFSVAASASGEDGLFMALGIQRSKAMRNGTHSVTYADVSHQAAPYSYGGNVPPCPAAPSCMTPADTNTIETIYTVSQNVRRRLNYWIIVTIGEPPKITMLSPGWRARRMQDPAFDVTQGDATGVMAGTMYAERFTHADLKGGPGGSIAMALSSCTIAGAGSVQLAGGQRRLSLPCRLTSISGFGSAFAPGSTRWSLDGDTTGVAGSRFRLAVIDLAG